MTRELNILTGRQACDDSDDEDCVDTVPHTCNYYSFPESFEVVTDELPGSGSGSGDPVARDDDTCASISVGPTDVTIVTMTTDEGVEQEMTTGNLTIVGSNAVKASSISLLTLMLAFVSLLSTSYGRYL